MLHITKSNNVLYFNIDQNLKYYKQQKSHISKKTS